MEESKVPSSIQFSSLNFEEAKKAAADSGKIIFMDAYTVWCGPCKKMDRDVFTDPGVAAFFNKNFINLQIDMEKGEGIDLSKTYKVEFYPTLMFIDKDGKVVKQAIGYHSAVQFLKLGQSVLEGKG